jgi:hypothetical protein
MRTRGRRGPGREAISPPPRSAAERGRWRRSRRRGRPAAARPRPTPPPSRRLSAPRHLPRFTGEERAVSSSPRRPRRPRRRRLPVRGRHQPAAAWRAAPAAGRADPGRRGLHRHPGRGADRGGGGGGVLLPRTRRGATVSPSPRGGGVAAGDGGGRDRALDVSPHRSFGSPPPRGEGLGPRRDDRLGRPLRDHRRRARPDRPPPARPRRPSARRATPGAERPCGRRQAQPSGGAGPRWDGDLPDPCRGESDARALSCHGSFRGGDGPCRSRARDMISRAWRNRPDRPILEGQRLSLGRQRV